MGKNYNKYNKWIGDDDYDASRIRIVYSDYSSPPEPQIPREMILSPPHGKGLFFGPLRDRGKGCFAGMPQGSEGNILIIGGNGSGKSSSIVKPTMETWGAAIYATDVKGELSAEYENLYKEGKVTRPYVFLDFSKPDSKGYDPFHWLLTDDESNLISNIWEMTYAIVPDSQGDVQPFWIETERSVFAAALLYYFKLGLSFSESICKIVSSGTSSLCEEILASSCATAKMLLGEVASLKPEVIAAVDRGLRNKLIVFASDPYIGHAFRGAREGADCFNWDDLNTHNIFLRIPENRIEQWGCAVNLIHAQLIRYLERRPDMYSPKGAGSVQTLLLMDEFARFGKLEMVANAMATLRSKRVNICLVIQSIAQLDKIYGEYDRRIIFDNCQYQAILRANDPETQRYLSELIGTTKVFKHSTGEHEDECGDTTSYSRQRSESREYMVFPHEFSTLKDILLRTPDGFCRVEKLLPYKKSCDADSGPVIHIKAVATRKVTAEHSEDSPAINETITVKAEPVKSQNLTERIEVKMLRLEERITQANNKIASREREMRLQERKSNEISKKQNQLRNYKIGELVTKYFPEVSAIEPGTNEENATRFEPLEAFLYVLATDYELIKELQARADQLMSDDPNREWRASV